MRLLHKFGRPSKGVMLMGVGQVVGSDLANQTAHQGGAVRLTASSPPPPVNMSSSVQFSSVQTAHPSIAERVFSLSL